MALHVSIRHIQPRRLVGNREQLVKVESSNTTRPPINISRRFHLLQSAQIERLMVNVNQNITCIHVYWADGVFGPTIVVRLSDAGI